MDFNSSLNLKKFNYSLITLRLFETIFVIRILEEKVYAAPLKTKLLRDFNF